MNKALVIVFISIATSECGIPFVYSVADPHDPGKVAKLRKALMRVGMSPYGITVTSFFEKFEIIRDSFKASYVNQLGEPCYMKWRVGRITGKQKPVMPICDNVAIGAGPIQIIVFVKPNQPPEIVVPSAIHPPDLLHQEEVPQEEAHELARSVENTHVARVRDHARTQTYAGA